jgi:hypothetical protein
VRKEQAGNATDTKVRVMEGAEREQEVAEMIGGQRVTEVTRAQARELLDAAREEFASPAAAPAVVKPRSGGKVRGKAS